MSLVVKRWANDIFSSSTTCVPFVYAATLLCYCGEDAKKKKNGRTRVTAYYNFLHVIRRTTRKFSTVVQRQTKYYPTEPVFENP